MDKVALVFDRLRLTRRSGYFFTLWVTWYSIQGCFEYAYAALQAGISPLEIAAVIAAILVPVSGLQGSVIGLYPKARESE